MEINVNHAGRKFLPYILTDMYFPGDFVTLHI